MKNEKKLYESPRLTAVSFRTEVGFALSGGQELEFLMLELHDANQPSNQVETYQQAGPSGNHWDFGNDNFWNY